MHRLFLNEHGFNEHVFNEHVFNEHVFNEHVFNEHEGTRTPDPQNRNLMLYPTELHVLDGLICPAG
jgi:hypothetical protein